MTKMALTNVKKGRLQTPFSIVLYGAEGIGKSTFAADAPSPIFLGSEDGTAELDVTRFPAPETFADALDAIDLLAKGGHEYRTFVLDTADWFEPIVWERVCADAGVKSIEDLGYGKGYVAAIDLWRLFLRRLDELKAKGMNVIILAHSHVRSFRNPAGDDYERFELKLHAKSAALLKEWPSAVLFARYRTYTHKDKDGRVRGVGDGSRVISTEHRPAWDAKNRYGLPEEIPLSWAEFEAHARPVEPANTDDVLTQIATLKESADPKVRAQVEDALTRADNDAKKLARLLDWLRGKVNQAA